MRKDIQPVFVATIRHAEDAASIFNPGSSLDDCILKPCIEAAAIISAVCSLCDNKQQGHAMHMYMYMCTACVKTCMRSK